MITQTKYRKYDSESDYYAMGYRMYSAEFGRFLAVDPLFEAMPRHNPYHYSFNSPLVWKDPSGLAPEKDKDKNSERLLEGDRLQSSEIEDSEKNVIAPKIESNYVYIGIPVHLTAEFDAGNAKGGLWPNYLPSTGNYGSAGSRGGRGNGASGNKEITKKGQSIPIVSMANLNIPLPENFGSPRYNDGIPELAGELIPDENYYRILFDFYKNPSKYEINPITGNPTGHGGYNPGDDPMFEAALLFKQAKTAELIINGAIKLAPKILSATSSLFLKINITENGLAHTLERHTMNGIERWLNKSKFFNANEVEDLIKQANSISPLIQPSTGNFVRIVDAHKMIGFDRTIGKGTSVYTVITNSNGNLITAFPGLP